MAKFGGNVGDIQLTGEMYQQQGVVDKSTATAINSLAENIRPAAAAVQNYRMTDELNDIVEEEQQSVAADETEFSYNPAVSQLKNDLAKLNGLRGRVDGAQIEARMKATVKKYVNQTPGLTSELMGTYNTYTNLNEADLVALGVGASSGGMTEAQKQLKDIDDWAQSIGFTPGWMNDPQQFARVEKLYSGGEALKRAQLKLDAQEAGWMKASREERDAQQVDVMTKELALDNQKMVAAGLQVQVERNGQVGTVDVFKIEDPTVFSGTERVQMRDQIQMQINQKTQDIMARAQMHGLSKSQAEELIWAATANHQMAMSWLADGEKTDRAGMLEESMSHTDNVDVEALLSDPDYGPSLRRRKAYEKLNPEIAKDPAWIAEGYQIWNNLHASGGINSLPSDVRQKTLQGALRVAQGLDVEAATPETAQEAAEQQKIVMDTLVQDVERMPMAQISDMLRLASNEGWAAMAEKYPELFSQYTDQLPAVMAKLTPVLISRMTLGEVGIRSGSAARTRQDVKEGRDGGQTASGLFIGLDSEGGFVMTGTEGAVPSAQRQFNKNFVEPLNLMRGALINAGFSENAAHNLILESVDAASRQKMQRAREAYHLQALEDVDPPADVRASGTITRRDQKDGRNVMSAEDWRKQEAKRRAGLEMDKLFTPKELSTDDYIHQAEAEGWVYHGIDPETNKIVYTKDGAFIAIGGTEK